MIGNYKNGKTLFVIGVTLVIISVVVFIGAYLLINNKDNQKQNETKENVETNDGALSNYTIKYNGFSFEIPTELVATTVDNTLVLEDNVNMWNSSIEVIEGQYNKLLKNKNELQGIYEKDGYETSKTSNKILGKTSFVTLEVSKDGENILLAIANANNTNMFGVIITNEDNEYAYEALNIVGGIISKTKYLGESVSITLGNRLDLSGISDISK